MSEVKIFPTCEVSFTACPLQTQYFEKLLGHILASKIEIQMCQYVFSVSEKNPNHRSGKILKAIIEASRRGVEVKILFDRPRPYSPNQRTNIRTTELLEKSGIHPRCLSVVQTLHIKMVIIDSKVFLAGSHNLTNSSLYSPYELTFECLDPVIINAAGIYFQCLWNGQLSEPFFDALKKR